MGISALMVLVAAVAIFEILLVQMNDIRIQLLPLSGNSTRCSPVKSCRERSCPIVVDAAVISANHSTESRNFLRQFIHPWVRGNPCRYFVSAISQAFA